MLVGETATNLRVNDEEPSRSRTSPRKKINRSIPSESVQKSSDESSSTLDSTSTTRKTIPESSRFLDHHVDPFLQKGTLPPARTGVDTLPRAFTWFPNSFIPSLFHPLLRSYISFWTPMLRDERDIIFISNILFTLTTTVPSALWLLYSFNRIHAIVHTVWMIASIPPFILMLHCVCHSKLGKKGYGWLDGMVHYVLSPFHGETWNTFYYHHVKHHHVEDNHPSDLSSTIWYDRDNAFHFAIYFSRFYFFIAFELVAYFVGKGQYKWAFNTFFGELSTLIFYASWFSVVSNPWSVIFAWFVPFNFARLGMMSGNWVQHAFVAVDDPTNDYKTAITCISDFYNQTCFNDGYHTSHHLHPLRHWDDHPTHFARSLETYKKERVMVFRNIDYWGIFMLLLSRRYDTLASHFVDLEEKKRSRAEIVDFIKSRLRRLTPEEIAKGFPSKKA